MSGAELRVGPEQFDHSITELGKFVAIPSVSKTTSPYFDMVTLNNAANFVGDRLRDLDFEVRLVRVNESAPYVIAERIVDAALPTLLFYAHYDVQPVDENEWKTKPFEMKERDGRLYGRGAADDKAGVMSIITALRVIKEAGKPLPVNIKVLSEGEEEIGSPNIAAFVDQEAAALHAHTMIVLDGLSKTTSFGTLTTATRGLVNLTLEVKALKEPKHSGLACLAPCPALALAVLVASIKSPEKIPGFMDDCEHMSEGERLAYRQTSQTPESYKREYGMLGERLRGNPETSVFERMVETPSISVVNMKSGTPGGGNSIQDSARCEIGVRITAGQDPHKIAKIVKEYLESQELPDDLGGVLRQVTVTSTTRPWKADLTKPFSQLYLESMRKHFPEVGAIPCGGSLPLLYPLQQAFRKKGFNEIDMMVPGMEDPDTNAHGHNESLDIRLYRMTIDTVISFIFAAAKVNLVQKPTEELVAKS